MLVADEILKLTSVVVVKLGEAVKSKVLVAPAVVAVKVPIVVHEPEAILYCKVPI